MEDLKKEYEKQRKAIRERLLEFKQVWKESDERIFEEMVFCFCTPQSSARSCYSAVDYISRSGILMKGDEKAISKALRGNVRFHNNKTRFIIEARDLFTDNAGKLRIKEILHHHDPLVTRQWLVNNVKGLGYKEAGHFLRNIGFGDNIAILDRHILRNMVTYGIIKEYPKTISKKSYLDLEERFRHFSKKAEIPMAELDLLFWAKETGEIFK